MKVLQIIPAHGAVAVFRNSDNSEDELPVLCWSLVETQEDGECPMQWVYGMVIEQGSSALLGVNELKDFVEYRYS